MFWILLAFIIGLVVGWFVTVPIWVKGFITKVVSWVVSKFKKTGS